MAALDGCSLGIGRGEVFGLLGPNGAGKTTLIRLLLGYLRPTSGHATIDGLDCQRDAVQVRRQVAYLPGDARLFRQMRGRDVLRFFAEIRPGGSFQPALDLAERLELDLSRRVAFMSTGMRQKLALAATLAADTSLLILDEPTANLDPTARNSVIDLVREARRDGRTVLFSSHVLSEVEEACDRVAILRHGKVALTQCMKELRRRHRIRLETDGEMPASPASLDKELSVERNGNGHVTIDTIGELSPLLAWLATVPLKEVSVEPTGLRSVYEEVHPNREKKRREWRVV